MDKNQIIVGVGALAIGTGVGFATGYYISKRKYEARLEEEIASVRESYAKAAQNTSKPDLEAIRQRQEENARRKAVIEQTQDYSQVVETEGYSAEAEETDAEIFQRTYGRTPSDAELTLMGRGFSPTDAVRDANDDADSHIPEGNIFDQVFVDPEDEGELAEQPISLDGPYVISAADWYLNETDYDQVTLTYWADDAVLVDDDHRIIPDIDRVVGDTNIRNRFGFKSEDPDVVYVRNDKLKVDYEVTKDERSWAEVNHKVKGGEDNETGTPRRMRGDDE